MRLLYKDQLRKIKLNKFNFVSLCILVMIISLTFTAVKSSIRRLDENYSSYLQEQNIEDFYLSMGKIDVNLIGGSALLTLCDELDIMYECGVAISQEDNPIIMNNLNITINNKIKEKPIVYENLIDSYIDEFLEQYDFTAEKDHIVNIIDGDFIYKFITKTESINKPYIVEGNMPDEDFEIGIFPEYAKLNNLDIGDTLIIQDVEYTISAFIYKPEYLLPLLSLDTITFDPQYQSLVLCNENTIRSLNRDLFTSYIIKGDLDLVFEDFGYEEIQSGDLSFLEKQMQMISILMPKDINFRIISLQTEVDNANAFIDVFLPLFLSFTIILLVIFMRRYVSKNEKDIITLHSLGYTGSEIARSITLYPFLISLSSILGFGLGLLASNQLFGLYSKRYLFPKANFSFDFDLLVYTVIIPIVTITLLNYFFILRSVKIRQREVKRFRFRLFKFVPIRTALTTSILFITIGIMLIFGLNGNSMFTSFVEETKLGNNFNTMVNLRYMTNSDHLDTYDEYTKVPGKIVQVNSTRLKKEESTTIYGINPDNNLKLLINNNIDNNLLLNDGIVISDYLKTSLNLKINDMITFEVGGIESTEKIVGFSNELIENNFFIKKDTLNSFYDLDNTYYNGLYVTDDDYDDPFIVSRLDYQNSIDEVASILNISTIILNILLVLSICLSLFIFSLIIIGFFTDNKIEIAILKSMGYNNIEITKKYLIPIYLIFVITYIISIPISQLLLNYLLLMLMESVGFKLIIDFSILNIIIGFVTLNILFTLLVIVSNRYYRNISITDIIKHNIK